MQIWKRVTVALVRGGSSEKEWYCRKSVQDERCIKVVDYSLVVDVAMDGLPTRLNRALFAALSGTTWVRPLFGEWSSLHNMAYGKQLNGAENERQAAASR